MALSPEKIAELERLKALMRQPANEFQRQAQAIGNAEKMGIPVTLPTDKKAKGGSAREKAFKQFMKGTKAKERVYHGTGNLENLESFDPALTGKGTDQLGSGFYFTTHPDEASGYATSVTPNVNEGTPKLGGNSSPGVVAAYLALRKPIKIGPKGSSLNDARINLSHDQVKQIMAMAPNIMHPEESPIGNHVDISRGITPKMLHDISRLYTGNALHALENDMFRDNPTAYRKALHKVLGYDSVIKDFGDGRKHYVAWFPEQIKSALGNLGTYDPTNPNITKAKGGQISQDAMRLALTKPQNKAQGGAVNPFDYENPEHVSTVAGHLAKHKDFKAYDPKILGEVLSTGNYRHIEDPRIQSAMRQAGHDAYHLLEKTGKKLHKMQDVVKKAIGGGVQPSVQQMRQQLMAAGKPLQDISQIGAQEAPNMPVKSFVAPDGNQGGIPVGGVDMNPQQPGQQFLPQSLMQPQQNPLQQQAQPPAPAPQGGSNILQMTPQGQKMAALSSTPQGNLPQQPASMATGGPVQGPQPVMNEPFQAAAHKPIPFMAKVGGSDDMPMDNQSMDNGATTFDIDNIQELAGGGNVQGYKERGYVHHTEINPHPKAGKRFVAEQLPGLMPEFPVDMNELYKQRASLQLRPWDSTSRHVKVSNVSGHALTNPLITEGGQGFARDIALNKEGISGASGREIQSRIQSRANSAHEENIKQGGHGHTYDIIANMDKVAPLFTNMPLHVQMDFLKQANLGPKELALIESRIRNRKVQGKTPFTNLLPLSHPEIMKQLTETNALRKAVSEELASKTNQKRLDYNLEDLLGAVTDPHIHAAPAGYAGNTFIANVPHAGLGPKRHSVYDTSGYGEYAGKGEQVPAELYMPDVFERVSNELQKQYPHLGASAIRSMTIGALQTRAGNISQMVNDRVMRNLERYKEGVKRGNIKNPNDLYGVLGHFYKEYGGYKKGGKVKLSTNMDTINLELSKSRKKAK